MTVEAFDTGTAYRFDVKNADGEVVRSFEWLKEPPEGRSLSDYLQDCKREALLLVEAAQPVEPTPVDL